MNLYRKFYHCFCILTKTYDTFPMYTKMQKKGIWILMNCYICWYRHTETGNALDNFSSFLIFAIIFVKIVFINF